MTRCELLLALGEARARAGDRERAKEAMYEAAQLAERHGLREQLGRAALGYGGRIIWDVSRDDARLVPLLERALEAVDEADSPMRVRLLARLAGGPLRDASFPPERKARLSEEALAMARRLDGDSATLAYAMHGYILGHHSPDHVRAQLELATELIEVAGRAGDKERVFDGHEERFDALVELGDVEAARVELAAMARVARELRQPSQAWLVGAHEALLALLAGPLEEAERLVERARATSANARRAGTRPSPIGSSSTRCVASRIGWARSRSSSADRSPSSRRTRSFAACRRTCSRSWARTTRRAPRSRRSPAAAAPRCPSTRSGS